MRKYAGTVLGFVGAWILITMFSAATWNRVHTSASYTEAILISAPFTALAIAAVGLIAIGAWLHDRNS